MVVFALGIFVFIARAEFGVRSYMLIIFTGFLLAFLVFLFPVYGFGPDILYRRSWLYLGLLMAIFAGYGVSVYFRSIPGIARIVASWFRRPTGALTAGVLWLMGTAVVVAVVITGLITNESRDQYSSVYHIVNERFSTDFRWIRQHIAPEQTVAMAEPGMGWAYVPVAGPRTVVFEAVLDPWTTEESEKTRHRVMFGVLTS